MKLLPLHSQNGREVSKLEGQGEKVERLRDEESKRAGG
jgi:hypothetical protein